MKEKHVPKPKNLFLIFGTVAVVVAACFFVSRTNLIKGESGHSLFGVRDYIFNRPVTKNEAISQQNLGNYYINIPKLNISAPIIQGVNPTDKKKYDEALEDGVAQMVGTPLPGTGKGNTFIYGHSSADQHGPYSQIFAGMDSLKFGDTININYSGKEYDYWVTEKKFVEKTDLSVLDQSDDERLTLMSCWPIGTDERRIIVVAKRK